MGEQQKAAKDKGRDRRPSGRGTPAVPGLRAVAEEGFARTRGGAPEDLAGKAAEKVLHKLRVHQIELEMQNEELQSTNEELQSINEELETSKEELQSLNEGLVTVNAELQAKNGQLVKMQNDLKNLLNNTDAGTIFLDERLAIKRFTRQTAAAYRLVASDVGRPLAGIK